MPTNPKRLAPFVPARSFRLFPRTFFVLSALFFSPLPAEADIVKLTNGRTMTVESCSFEGSEVIFKLSGGGLIRAPKTIVDEILPDEIPFARTVAIEALAASPSASRLLPDETGLKALVDRIAAKVGLDRKLAHAMVKVESNYDPRAISRKGAMGLMQLMPAVANQYGLEDPFDPEKNLEAGMLHMRGLLGRYDLSRALAAYNAGSGAVQRYGAVPPYRETQDYVKRITALVK